MVQSKNFPLSLLLVVIVFGIIGCSGSKSKGDDSIASVSDSTKYIHIPDAEKFLDSWSKDNVAIVHVIGEPDDLHPTNGNAEVRDFIFKQTHIYLIRSDFHHLDLAPGLAKAMPEVSADYLNYIYEVRTDMTWDDGSPITVEDVIFTSKANICPLTDNPHAKPYWENTEDIIADPNNPNKFTVKMKRPYVQNIAMWTDYPIMQRKYFDPKNVLAKYSIPQLHDPNFKADKMKDLNDWASEFNNPKYSRDPKHLVGAGPYQIVSWEPGQTLMLEKKKNHWSQHSTSPYEIALLDKIIFKVNNDANSQMLEFKSQALDGSVYLSTAALMELQKDANFNTNYNSRFTVTYNFTYAGMNTKPDGVKHKKLFTDKKVRRAVALLTPVDDIIAVVSKGKGERMAGPVSPLKEEYNRDLTLIPYDIEQAKKLLDEAGWKDTDGNGIRDKMIDGEKVPFEFELKYMTTQVQWKDMAVMMAESYYKAGIKANLKAVDFANLYDDAKKHNFDMMLAGWAGSSIPEDFTQIWHTSSWATQGSNYTGFGNAESDALIDSIKYTVDMNKRIPLVKKLQAIIYEDQPYVFISANLRRNVIHKRFGNCDMFFERPGVMVNNWKLLASPTAGF